jgi:putative DNA primase/helicase
MQFYPSTWPEASMSAAMIEYTIFDNVRAQSARVISSSWEDFAAGVRTPKRTYPSKGSCPLVKLARCGDKRSTNNSLRHDANIIEVWGIELDYDAGQVPLGEAAMLLGGAGIEAVLYTSPSHTSDRPRWRVLLPLSQPRAPGLREKYAARVNGVLGGVVAPESFVLSQSYFIGKVDGVEYEAQLVHGACVDTLDGLDAGAIFGPPQRNARADKAAEVHADPVCLRLTELGLVRRVRPDHAMDIDCPFRDAHTSPGGASATTYFPAHTGGFVVGAFKCMHLHCALRSQSEFVTALGLGDPKDAGLASADTSAEWPDPEPLPSLPAVAPFRYEFLPPVLRDFVADIAERMQCPPDYPAMACIIMCGSLIGRKLRLFPRQHGDWGIVPNLWGQAIGRPGFKKSPSQDAALAPIHKLQERAFEQWAAEQKIRDIESKRAKLLAKANQDKARAKLKKSKFADVADLLSDCEEEADLQPKRYLVNDSTCEALAEILEANPNGVLLNRDELSGWFASLEKEGQQAARSFFLTAADGDKSYTVDRILRGKHRHIDALCVSIIGGIQPGLLARHVRATQQFGSGDDGLLQRFALSVYPDLSSDYVLVDRAPNVAAFAAIMSLVEHLDSPDLALLIGAEQSDKGHFLRFTDAARVAFEAWEVELQHRVRGTEEHPSMRSHLAKYPRMVGALALILHLADNPMGGGPVSSRALARALATAEYLETHARRIYSHATHPEVEAANALLEKIKAKKLESPFSLRDVYRKSWSGISERDQVFQATKLLAEMNCVREEKVDTQGRPAALFHVNPKLRGAS